MEITHATKQQLSDEFDDWYKEQFNCYPSSDVFNWFYGKWRAKIDEMNGNQFRAYIKWQDEKKELESKINELTNIQ